MTWQVPDAPPPRRPTVGVSVGVSVGGAKSAERAAEGPGFGSAVAGAGQCARERLVPSRRQCDGHRAGGGNGSAPRRGGAVPVLAAIGWRGRAARTVPAGGRPFCYAARGGDRGPRGGAGPPRTPRGRRRG